MQARAVHIRNPLLQLMLALVMVALCGTSRGGAVPAGELLDGPSDGDPAPAGVTPKVNAQLPLDATVVDESGVEK